MDPNYLRIPGIIFVLIGVFFVFGSSSGITGFAIAEEAESGFGYLFGFSFLVIGLVLFSVGRGVNKSRERNRNNLDFDVAESREAAKADYLQRFRRMPTQEEAFSYERRLKNEGKIVDAVASLRRNA